jgi:hypothetical protein
MLTAAVIKDKRSGGNSGTVVMSFTAPDAHVYVKETVVGGGLDALTIAQDTAGIVEDAQARAELLNALALAKSRVDPHTVPLHISSTEEMRAYVIRQIVNIPREKGYDWVEELINCNVMLNLFTNAQILAYLDGGNIGQVNGFVNFVDGLETSLTTFVPAIPVQEG